MNDDIFKKTNISNTDELQEYLIKKAHKHRRYKYYLPKKFLYTIIKNNSIYLSNGENWNDRYDSQNFIEDGNNFGICFSYSYSENVSMWMLYSGNDGYMIDFSNTIMKKIINTEEISLGCFQNGNFIEDKTLKSHQFKITLSDIVYFGKSTIDPYQNYYVRRSSEYNKNCERHFIDDLKIFKKKISWFYENECRLMVSVDKNEVDINNKVLRIELPEEFRNNHNIYIFDSPNSTNVRYNESKLANDLNWNLCRDCLREDVKH